MTNETIEILLERWAHARNTEPSARLRTTEATHAGRCGLPTLAALLHLMERLEQSRSHISALEMLAELAPLVALARGEAQVRLRERGVQHEIPGIVALPSTWVL
jgi:hypothetical protein